jgi:hypothetical protein
LAKAAPGIWFNEHLECDDGEIVFHHACKLEVELPMLVVNHRPLAPSSDARPRQVGGHRSRGTCVPLHVQLGPVALVTGVFATE